MARKRVSWELIVGSMYLYYDVRKQAVEQARKEKAEGHPIEMNRWEIIGDETSHKPVDLGLLIAQAEEAEAQEAAEIDAVLNAPLQPLPQSVLRDVARALSD